MYYDKSVGLGYIGFQILETLINTRILKHSLYIFTIDMLYYSGIMIYFLYYTTYVIYIYYIVVYWTVYLL